MTTLPEDGLAYYNENDLFACEWLQGLMDAGEIMPGTIDNRSITDVKADDIAGYERCHFFAGIGGWELALRLAGWSGPVWTGSCPCQPYSSAGQRRGHKDARDLWPAFARLIAACRPPIVFGEQVASAEVVGTQLEGAFVDAVQGGDYARANKLAKRLAQSSSFHYWPRWVDRVQADVAKAGYAFGFTILGAHSVSAPHIRQRLYWVADSEGVRHACVDSLSASAGWRTTESGIRGRATGGLGIPDRTRPQQGNGTAEAAGYGCTAEPAGAWSDFAIVHCRDGKVRRISVRPGDEPLAHGIPRKLGSRLARVAGMAKAARRNRVGRVRGYGNAIVPQVAAEFVRAFMVSRVRGLSGRDRRAAYVI